MLSLFPSTYSLELRHPVTGDPTGLVLELVSIDHDDLHAAKLDVLKSLKARGLTDAADVIADLDTKIHVLAAAVTDWKVTSDQWRSTFKTVFGFEDESFSRDKIKALLTHKTAAWIRAQIDTALSESERFFPKASAN
jgi:hypothetical protein